MIASEEEARALASRLRAAARSPHLSLAERAEALATAARRFLDPNDPIHREALSELPNATKLSPAMVEACLPRIFRPLEERALVLAGARAGKSTVALVAIVSAGNVPGVALPKMALALAAGSACLVKTASGEPILARLFERALRETSPKLAERVAVLSWTGGRAPWEAALLGAADSLVAYGSDAAVAALGRSSGRFVGHGHRVSLGVATSGDPAAAEAAALDVALFDQRGCLSPHSIHLADAEFGAVRAFARKLAGALEALERVLPRGMPPESASIAIRRLRDESEWRALRGEPVEVYASARGTEWTVIADADVRFRESPLHRAVFVRPFDLAAFDAVADRIESVGVGSAVGEPILARLRARSPRVVALGTMQEPDLSWRQGGLDPLAGIVLEGNE